MNGLQITGMKLSSPPTTKKNNTTTNQPQLKQQPKEKAKKPSVPTTNIKKSPIVPKKDLTKKVEQKTIKKQQANHINQKQKQIKNEEKEQSKEVITQQKVIIKQNKQIEKQQIQPVLFDVMVKYNHYKEKFPCINGVLSFANPNQKYCFSLVFKGNYQPLLRHFKSRQIVEPLSTGKAPQFSWKVIEGEIYQVQIQEDEQQQSKYERTAYKAPEKSECPIKRKNKVDDLTNDMKKMGVHELGSQKHKQLLEQRDLQDILYG